MQWLSRLLGRSNAGTITDDWRVRWQAAVQAPTSEAADALRHDLDRLSAGSTDRDAFEIEREMLEGLDALLELTRTLATEGPAVIQTGHRAIGREACHLSAPASLPDDPAQASGTVLITATRLVVVGGARSLAIPWHAIARATPQGRDLLLVRVDRPDLHRLRFNSYADALRAAGLAAHFTTRRV